ncbi:hypothetical protein SAMN02745181_2089 [Rubritalea squalenifaciens DSM 18772]|uniref:Uncharacterized protein n=1 Tax=Rubritalea squalenifaciens DSM 18772 TaxID=1123071 RepID=A0A1M6JDI1_9BACT|nr:hypothetical protein [Rubritalea squalenifaciens]SHJ44755.1 hypothetical protein SAMN02745181_2089 [Rubritalea squalenifaciens DSM 18772]
MKSITSTIYMKPEAEGGRHFGLRQDYCPHLIPAGTDEWIPVRVTGIEGAEEASLGTTSTVTF